MQSHSRLWENKNLNFVPRYITSRPKRVNFRSGEAHKYKLPDVSPLKLHFMFEQVDMIVDYAAFSIEYIYALFTFYLRVSFPDVVVWATH